MAADLGVTGTALSKACARLNVPKPPRGYWAKVAMGRRVTRPPLPATSVGVRTPPAPKPRYDPPAVTFDATRQPVLARTARAYRDAPVDLWGRLLPRGSAGPTVDLMVSPTALDRALQVWGLLLQAARAARIGVRAEGHQIVLSVKDEPIRLRLKEEVRMEPGLPIRPARYPWEEATRQKARGTGRLTLEIREPQGVLPVDAWVDGTRPLELQIQDMIDIFRQLPARARAHREERAAAAERHRLEELDRERRRHAEALRQAERRRRDEEAQACHEALLMQAHAWEEGRRLRAYVTWVGAQVELSGAEPDGYAMWVAWAEARITELDPVRSGAFPALVHRVLKMDGASTEDATGSSQPSEAVPRASTDLPRSRHRER